MNNDNLDEILKSTESIEDENNEKCKITQVAIDDYLNQQCEIKAHELESCDDDTPCPCSTASGSDCTQVDIPDIKPCISISWGDSDCDNLKTDDFEVLCISVCNCYSNVTFKNLTIGWIYVSNVDGTPVPKLPNGTPSIKAIPLGPICFGNINPCIDGRATCVSREFVLNMCGAKAGKYKIKLGSICYDITHHFSEKSCFNIDLCES